MQTTPTHTTEPKQSPTAKQPFFQPKLTVNEPGDVYEQEADAVADRVMRMPDPAATDANIPFNKVSIASLQRKCASCEDEEKVQRKESKEEEPPLQLKRISDLVIQRQCAACGEEEHVQRKETVQREEKDQPSTVPSVALPRLTLPQTPLVNNPTPNYRMPLPELSLNIDWLSINTELHSRRASHLLQPLRGDIEQLWLRNYQIYQTLGLGPQIALWATNKTIATSVGNYVSRDYSTQSEIFERGLPSGGFKIPNIPLLWGSFDLGVAGSGHIYRKSHATESSSPSTAPPIVSDVISGSGQPLDAGTRQFMESRMGQDFSNVQIHTDSHAAASAQAINALAYTSGKHIVFNSGQYQPHSESGKRLLAHELVHVGQQSQDSASQIEIQRQESFVAKDKPSGTYIHSKVLPAFGKTNPDLFTEVSIPGANAMDIDKGKTGIADMYKASTTIAVFINENGQLQYLQRDPDLHKGAHKWEEEHKTQGAPIGPHPNSKTKAACENEQGTRMSLCRVDTAPKEIKLGELKPAESAGAAEAEGQLKNYEQGLINTKDSINEFIKNNPTLCQPPKKHWNLKPIGRLGNLKSPEGYGTKNNKSPESPLKLYGTLDAIVGLIGKLVVYPQEPKKSGIWVYEWIPTKIPASLKKWESKKFHDALVRLNGLIVKLKQKNNTVSKKAQASSTPVPLPFSTNPNRNIIQRSSYDSKVWQEEYTLWQKDNKAWADNTSKNNEIKTISALSHFEKRPELSDMKLDFPKNFNEAGQYSDKVLLWLKWGQRFGQLRGLFGNFALKISTFYSKIHDKVKGFFDGGDVDQIAGLGAEKGVVGKVLSKIFKIAKIFIKKTISMVVQKLTDSIQKGIHGFIDYLFEDTFIESIKNHIEKYISQFDFIEKFDLLQKVEDFISPFKVIINKILEIKKWVTNIKSIVSQIKWFARIINCLTPPGWGCLKILFSSITEFMLEKVVESCHFQKEYLLPFMKKTDFVSNFPQTISNFIIEEVRELIPLDNALKDRFLPIVKSDNVRLANDDLKCQSTITPEKIAIRKLLDKHGEEKIKKLILLLEKAGARKSEKISLNLITQLDTLLNDLSELDLDAALENLNSVESKVLHDVIQNIKLAAQASVGGSGNSTDKKHNYKVINVPTQTLKKPIKGTKSDLDIDMAGQSRNHLAKDQVELQITVTEKDNLYVITLKTIAGEIIIGESGGSDVRQYIIQETQRFVIKNNSYVYNKGTIIYLELVD